MAKLNFALLQGLVVKIVDKRAENNTMFVQLKIGRPKSDRFDSPILLVDKPHQIEELLKASEDIKRGDNVFVNITGQLETYNVDLRMKCVNPECGIPFERSTMKMFVRPKTLKIFKSDVPVYINEIHMLGALVTDVKSDLASTQAQRSTYKMALNAYKNKAHYPWVVSFHEQAISDKLRMGLKSQCFVKGFFQTRLIDIGCTCPIRGCETKQPRQITTSEIMATNVEYLNKCRFEKSESIDNDDFVDEAIVEAVRQDFPSDHPIHRKNEGQGSPVNDMMNSMK